MLAASTDSIVTTSIFILIIIVSPLGWMHGQWRRMSNSPLPCLSLLLFQGVRDWRMLQ